MSQVFSSIICGTVHLKSRTTEILLESALELAEKGSLVIFIARRALSERSLTGLTQYVHRPVILERLNFRYFTTREEIIEWCHDLHTFRSKPHAIFLCDIEDFITNKFDFFELCSALSDCCSYCSTFHGNDSHFCVSLNEMNDLRFATLYNLFNKVWCFESMVN